MVPFPPPRFFPPRPFSPLDIGQGRRDSPPLLRNRVTKRRRRRRKEHRLRLYATVKVEDARASQRRLRLIALTHSFLVLGLEMRGDLKGPSPSVTRCLTLTWGYRSGVWQYSLQGEGQGHGGTEEEGGRRGEGGLLNSLSYGLLHVA